MVTVPFYVLPLGVMFIKCKYIYRMVINIDPSLGFVYKIINCILIFQTIVEQQKYYNVNYFLSLVYCLIPVATSYNSRQNGIHYKKVIYVEMSSYGN